MKRLILAAAATAFLIGAPALAPARAGDAPTAPAKTIQWVDGWSAGRDAAKKSGKLMLVYVHRNKPT